MIKMAIGADDETFVTNNSLSIHAACTKLSTLGFQLVYRIVRTFFVGANNEPAANIKGEFFKYQNQN